MILYQTFHRSFCYHSHLHSIFVYDRLKVLLEMVGNGTYCIEPVLRVVRIMYDNPFKEFFKENVLEKVK